MSEDFKASDKDQNRVPNEGLAPRRGKSLTVFVILAVAIVSVMLFVSNRSSDVKNDPKETAPTTQPRL
ncbi:hypothetical protein [Methylopila sp. 73B]|uniref:hypothetical protein n=1 Tax=Methylopila sp. 73B TaxID=1120792 RepID=UPI0003749EE3|nr:hypothetical protein [Methylopila sp. 73B]